jgi:hypothetical protein
MSTIVKSRDKDFLDLFANSYRSSNSSTHLSEANRQCLKQLVNYLTKLKEDNLLDEKQFSELIILACANYIENEVEAKVSKLLNDKIFFLIDKL